MELPKEALKVSLKDILTENALLQKSSKVLEEELTELRDAQQDAFHIDVCPEDSNGHDTQPMDDQEQILYDSDRLDALRDEDETAKDDKGNAEPAGKSSCWNCGEAHVLSDCPHPRDGQRIAAARREFMKNQPASVARYHIDEPQRFAHPASILISLMSSPLNLRNS